MLNITELLGAAFLERLYSGYAQNHGDEKPEYQDIIAWAATTAVQNIANSDALYHSVEHTILVTLVGQTILRGKQLGGGGVTPSDWLHVVLSLLCHDVGYVKGVCPGDKDELYAKGRGDERIALAPGTTDASLMPYHVDRGKLYVESHFANHPAIDTQIIKRNIELTRFPIPTSEDPPDTADYPSLVRAADLIGQLGDPRYLKKIPALFYEFQETGFNQTTGYKTPEDLLKHYPEFYWNGVYPYIGDALHYLSLTQEGQQIIASLYGNLFVAERHGRAESGRAGQAL